MLMMIDEDDALTPEKITELAENYREEARLKVMQQSDALIDAGWKWELPRLDQTEVWSWYWRRPPRRKGSKG